MNPLEHAKKFWCTAARISEPFPAPGTLRVVVAPDSDICPAGWSGVVVLDDGVLVTTPSTELAELVRDTAPTPADLAEPGTLRGRFAVRDLRGPSALGYLSEVDFQSAAGVSDVETVAENDPVVHRLIAATGQDDLEESGIDDLHSPAFVLRDGGAALAISGYRRLPAGLAHLCVLTDRRTRNRGMARAVAAAAVAHALAAGLVPQWRARRMASRRVAATLGFREHGTQCSMLLCAAQP